ncbi:hypothetical protein RhiirA5_433554, partial [Rhizophagus irregularis]
AKSHLTISNKYAEIVQCFGLTQDPSDGNYMLIMRRMDANLREYLQQNHNQLKWKERMKITFLTIDALYKIHKENSIHRDFHSGNNIIFTVYNTWCISDFGFCGPANKSTCIYGNLPYIYQISNNPNPFKLTTTMTKPQTKVSWVWEYFVRKQSENGEIRAYCQFISDNGENVQKVINMMDLLLSME